MCVKSKTCNPEINYIKDVGFSEMNNLHGKYYEIQYIMAHDPSALPVHLSYCWQNQDQAAQAAKTPPIHASFTNEFISQSP